MPNQIPDAETARYRAGWDIIIDKWSRYEDEMTEAEEIWEEVKIINKDYQKMKIDALEKQRK